MRTYDEETRGILRKILEGQAYRQLMLSNIRGHGLRFLPEVRDKLRTSRALVTSLEQFADVERLHALLGLGDVVSAVRNKMDRVPYPATRMELAVCLFLCERVSWHALASYTDSSAEEFALIARARLSELRALEEPEDPAFLEFCSEETNRPLAQQHVNRWLQITLLSLGRPKSPGDARAIELGLRTKPIDRIVREYLDALVPFLTRCGLVLPDGAALGLELPAAPKSKGA